jgi:hypothetical protein
MPNKIEFNEQVITYRENQKAREAKYKQQFKIKEFQEEVLKLVKKYGFTIEQTQKGCFLRAANDFVFEFFEFKDLC